MGRFGEAARTLPLRSQWYWHCLGPVTWEPSTQGPPATLLGWDPPCSSVGALGIPRSSSPSFSSSRRPCVGWRGAACMVGAALGKPRCQDGAELLHQREIGKTSEAGGSACSSLHPGLLEGTEKAWHVILHFQLSSSPF